MRTGAIKPKKRLEIGPAQSQCRSKEWYNSIKKYDRIPENTFTDGFYNLNQKTQT
jgi:hypothetical protein